MDKLQITDGGGGPRINVNNMNKSFGAFYIRPFPSEDLVI